jgi:hypothetical protein
MKKSSTVSTEREQGTSKRTKNHGEAKARGFKVRTSLKAGADPNTKLATNHNEAVSRNANGSTKPGTGKRTKNDGEAKARGFKVRTNVKAGAGANPGNDPNGRLAANHNETLAR